MIVYFFGNPDFESDSWAVEIGKQLTTDFPDVEIKYIKPNQDLPFDKKEELIILDTVSGISEVTVFTDSALEKIELSPRTSAHEFDLGFQLKYLKKLGKLPPLKIIGIPMTGNYDYSSVHSIFKKLVAQDMQGS